MMWRLKLCRSYVKISMLFENLEDAGRFLTEFIRRREPDEDDEKYKWRYKIEPVEEAPDSDGTEDDIPVQ